MKKQTTWTNIMLDIETMGKEPNSAILTIGASLFRQNALGIVEINPDLFYSRVELADSVRNGSVDGETLRWWLSQSSESLAELVNPDRYLLKVCLQGLSSFINKNCNPSKVLVWANSPSFDCTILESAYKRFDMEKPWEYYNQRCYRTMKGLFNVAKPEIENNVKHHAADDALMQVEHLKLIVEKQKIIIG